MLRLPSKMTFTIITFIMFIVVESLKAGPQARIAILFHFSVVTHNHIMIKHAAIIMLQLINAEAFRVEFICSH